MVRKKIIKVVGHYGMNDELQKEFHVSRTTVTNALHGRTNSELAKRIRQRAVNMGARVLKEEVTTRFVNDN